MQKGIFKSCLLVLGFGRPESGCDFIKLYFGEIVMKASWVGIAAAALMFAGQAGAADVDNQSASLFLHDRRRATAAKHRAGEVACE